MASTRWVDNQIKDVVSRINEYAEENEGEISEELLAELEQWEGAKDGAIDEMTIEYKSIKTKAEMVKAQIKALQTLQKEIEDDAESMRKSIGLVLQGEKFTSANSKVSYRKSSSVCVYDENLLPDEFVVVKETVSIAKKEIAKALKNGDVDGAVMETKISVVIK